MYHQVRSEYRSAVRFLGSSTTGLHISITLSERCLWICPSPNRRKLSNREYGPIKIEHPPRFELYPTMRSSFGASNTPHLKSCNNGKSKELGSEKIGSVTSHEEGIIEVENDISGVDISRDWTMLKDPFWLQEIETGVLSGDVESKNLDLAGIGTSAGVNPRVVYEPLCI